MPPSWVEINNLSEIICATQIKLQMIKNDRSNYITNKYAIQGITKEYIRISLQVIL